MKVKIQWLAPFSFRVIQNPLSKWSLNRAEVFHKSSGLNYYKYDNNYNNNFKGNSQKGAFQCNN